MSWLARSIANSLQINDEPPSPPPLHHRKIPQEDSPENAAEERESDGVKEDLTVFKESLTRQLWGVANFLAPPPPPPPPPLSPSCRNGTELNWAESNSGDEEFVKDDRDQLGVIIRDVDNRDEFELRTEGDWGREVAGLTEEVLTFAGNVAHHPETWLDFPVDDDEDFDDFPMSESQKRHTQAVEHLTPRLAALRIELCPAHMSIGFFWKVYFVLLHSRLNKQDADLLSTPEIVEARTEWMQELQKRAKKDSEQRYHGGRYGSADFDEDFTPTSLQNDHSETYSSWTFASEPATSSTTADSDTEKHVSNDIQYTERSAISEKPLLYTIYRHNYAPTVSMRPDLQFDDDDDDDDWPEDDCLLTNGKVISVGIDEDISFSDLEDDDCCIPVISKPGFQV